MCKQTSRDPDNLMDEKVRRSGSLALLCQKASKPKTKIHTSIKHQEHPRLLRNLMIITKYLVEIQNTSNITTHLSPPSKVIYVPGSHLKISHTFP